MFVTFPATLRPPDTAPIPDTSSPTTARNVRAVRRLGDRRGDRRAERRGDQREERRDRVFAGDRRRGIGSLNVVDAIKICVEFGTNNKVAIKRHTLQLDDAFDFGRRHTPVAPLKRIMLLDRYEPFGSEAKQNNLHLVIQPSDTMIARGKIKDRNVGGRIDGDKPLQPNRHGS